MDRFHQSIDEQATGVLSDMIERGIYDTPLDLSYPYDYAQYFHWFLAIGEKKRAWQNPQSYELWTAAQSQRWHESHLSARTQPDIAQYWAVELAQFPVPDGQIGFVRYLEQVVNDVNGSYYPTNVSFWGSPHFVDPDVDNIRWYLTISEYYGTLPQRFEQTSAVPIPINYLPGHPYTDLPEIDGLWYPAHCRKQLKLIVPGKHVLRFFMMTPPTTFYRWTVSGKISGNTQSTYQDCAIRNARRIY